MSSADWLEWLNFKPVDFDHRLELSTTSSPKGTSKQNSIGGVWLNSFGWQRPFHWPMPKSTAKSPQPFPKPDPNPLGWSEEALEAMKELEELFD